MRGWELGKRNDAYVTWGWGFDVCLKMAAFLYHENCWPVRGNNTRRDMADGVGLCC